jgi:hypothetical protein
MANPLEYSRELIQKLKRLISGNPGRPPEDPYSYVTAPKRPRLPHLSAAAVAEPPNSRKE